MADHRARDVSRTLDLHEVLEDECAALYPGSGVTPARLDDPDAYLFSVDQIRDIPALARMIDESTGLAANPSAARIAVAAIAAGQNALLAEAQAVRADSGSLRPAAAFTELLVTRLNALVSSHNLVADARFRDLREHAGVVAADSAETRRPRANRLLIEAALAPAVTRVRDVRLAALRARIRPSAPTALCLSGGGIRSCAFALGVVTALARRGLLGKFDYLSTVSGGGYLGGWLSAWMAHQGAGAVQRGLAGHSRTTLDPEPDAVRYLRSYTAFLTPRLGLFSADTWTLIGTLIRNLLLNWLVILPLLAGVVMLPRAASAILRSREQPPPVGGHALPIALGILAFALGAWALVYVYRNRPGALSGEAERTQRAFLARCLMPLLASAWTFSYAWWLFGAEITGSLPAWAWFGPAMAMNLAAWGIGSRGRGWSAVDAVVVAASGAAVGLLAPWLLDALSKLADWPSLQRVLNLPADLLRPRLFVTLAIPLFMLLIMNGGQLLVGLASTRSSNADREWNARFNAWMLIAMLGWAGACGIILLLPPLFEHGWRDPRLLGLHAAGALSGVIATLLGGSSATPATPAGVQAATVRPALPAAAKRIAAALAAPVFAVSLVAVISVFNAQVVLRGLCDAIPSRCQAPPTTSPVDLARALGHAGDYYEPLLILLTALGLIAAGWGLGHLIDTNQFSLHAMYRTRLVRAFLGASRSRAARAPDPFTGFDERDDFPLAALWPPSTPAAQRDRDDSMPPLHVINVTLNIVEGRSRAWQERKAESMTLSSLHAGAPFLGHRRTRQGWTPGTEPVFGGPHGISLGNAITISGAAASPEAGYNSSPAISFLMALFNGRLGSWLGNPGAPGDRTFGRPGPRIGVAPLLSEMFGLTTDRSAYVFLSDGGHFENLGLYAMVLRRCRCIVLSDAGCDPDFAFEDLGNAIRKIRIDLGISIDFPDDEPPFGRTPETDATAFRGWAVGRIRYSQVDRRPGDHAPDDDYDGVLVYLKPALCGGEPVDVVNYSRRSPAFPHESTTNQFFTESQFESYRSLGIFETERMCQALGADATADRLTPDLHREPMRWLLSQRIAEPSLAIEG